MNWKILMLVLSFQFPSSFFFNFSVVYVTMGFFLFEVSISTRRSFLLVWIFILLTSGFTWAWLSTFSFTQAWDWQQYCWKTQSIQRRYRWNYYAMLDLPIFNSHFMVEFCVYGTKHSLQTLNIKFLN